MASQSAFRFVSLAAVLVVGAGACEQPAVLSDGRTPEQLALDQLLQFQGVIVAGQFRDDATACAPPNDPPQGEGATWAPLEVATFDVSWAGPPVLVDGVETQVFEAGQAVSLALLLPLSDEPGAEVYLPYGILGVNPGFVCAGDPTYLAGTGSTLPTLTRAEIEAALAEEPVGELLRVSLLGHAVAPPDPEEEAP